MRALLISAVVTLATGCVREVPMERIDEPMGTEPRERAALLRLDCSSRRIEVRDARDTTQPDFDRVANYRLALKAFAASAARLEDAFAKDPDLAYGAEADALNATHARCLAQGRDFANELRKFEVALQVKHNDAVAEDREVESKPLEPLAKKVKKAAAKKRVAHYRGKHKKRHSAALADASGY